MKLLSHHLLNLAENPKKYTFLIALLNPKKNIQAFDIPRLQRMLSQPTIKQTQPVPIVYLQAV